jgi:hypothetical protein
MSPLLRCRSLVFCAWLCCCLSNRDLPADDNTDLKRRYFRLYMEYQNVEVSGVIVGRSDGEPFSHNFVVRFGASVGGKFPPIEMLSVIENPGEPHIRTPNVVDEAYALSRDFLNVQFRREYISMHRRDKFLQVDESTRKTVEVSKEKYSKSLRLSNLNLTAGSTCPHSFFYPILESLQMGLDGFCVREYSGHEEDFERKTEFEILGTEDFLGYACKRVRYRDQSDVAIEALVATEPTFQVLKIINVVGGVNGLDEDSKSIWLNLPKTESIRKFDMAGAANGATHKFC